MRPNTTCGMPILALTLIMDVNCADDGSTTSTANQTTIVDSTITTIAAPQTSTGNDNSTSADASACECDSGSDSGSTSAVDPSTSTSTGATGESSSSGEWCHDSTTSLSTGDFGSTASGDEIWGPVPTTGGPALDCCEQYGSLEVDPHYCAADFGNYCYFCTWESTVCLDAVCTKEGAIVECCLDDYGMTIAC